MKRKAGFTLLELMIVIIIVGILAAVGIPLTRTAAEKARMSEAANILGSYHRAQLRYRDLNNAYAADIGELDVSHVGNKYWTFSTDNTGVVYAKRNALKAGALAGNDLQLNPAGVFSSAAGYPHIPVE